jgi:glycosyltransferase involved in cell wall biosynthesis
MPPAAESPLRVLRVIARLNVGGPAKHVVWLAAGLPQSDFQTLLVTGVVPPGEDDMSYFARAHEVEPLVIPEMSREISTKDIVTVWKLYRVMRTFRPDIIHTHTAKAGAVGRAAGFLYRWLTPGTLFGRPRTCRIVHTYHGHVFHGYYGRFKSRIFVAIERLLARVATDRIIVLSEQQRVEIHEQFGVGDPEQFVILPLGLDLSIFENAESRREEFRSEIGAGGQEVLVGIVGRLTEIKHHELFLQAASRVGQARRAGFPVRIRFLIIGDGQRRKPLEQEASRLRLGEDLQFLGTRWDPERFYPGLDIVALTSKNEGTPLTLIEAMANGRPIVSTAVGGVVDLLGDVEEQGDGYFVGERGLGVRSGDAGAFAEALLRLAREDRLRAKLGERGRRFIESHYSKLRLTSDIATLYRDLFRSA